MDELKGKIQEIKELAGKEHLDINQTLEEIEDLIEKRQQHSHTCWETVRLARHQERPRALDYINMICDDFIELHGDRYHGDDPALIGGIGMIGDLAVTFIGHQKGKEIQDNIYRNYGMASPEGYRKAMRLAKQAEKFNRPIVSFIDTPGAYPGPESEERSVGEAIAQNLKYFSILKVPIICFVIGEGGSGGALGIGIGDRLYMLENSIYSVISPEGFAAIILEDQSKTKEAAAMMKMRAKDLQEFGIIDDIIPEDPEGAHNDPAYSAKQIKKRILSDIKDLRGVETENLLRMRSDKIRSLGRYAESSAKDQDKPGLFSRLFS